jgi:RecA-family ATPase
MQQKIPHDPDLEMACCTTLLNCMDDAAILCEKLSQEDFYSPKCRAIFRAVKDSVESGGFSTDLNGIKARLQSQHGIGKEIQISELMRVRDEIPIFMDIAGSVARLQEFSRLRNIQKVGVEIIRRAGACDDPAEIINFFNESIGAEPGTSKRGSKISPADLPALTARRFMFSEPLPIKWLLLNSLQCGVVGLLVANSGVGKSFFILHMVISIILKTPLFSGIFHSETSGSVFLLAGEDSEDAIHHRLLSIVRAMYPPKEYPDAYAHACEHISQKLFIFSIAGKDFRLTKRTRENVEASPTYMELFNALKAIDDLALVIFDPFSRFYSENEIDAVQQTFFVSLMEKITREIPSKPNVLISAHANKASGMRRGKSELVQEMIRGATGLTAGARWQIDLVLMSDEEIKKAGGNLNEPYNYLWGKVVKKNVGPPEKAFALRRLAGGVLSRLEIVNDDGSSDADVLEMIMDKLGELEKAGNYKTINTFVDDYASRFHGYGRKKLKTLIEESIEEEMLFVVKRKAKNGVQHGYLSATDF